MDNNINNELMHYGVKGMKWGVRRASKYINKARIARDSAKEWDEMARYAQSRGNAKKAAKYSRYAAKDRQDANAYDREVKKANAETAKTKAAIKSYRSKYNAAEIASNMADKKWNEVSEKHKALGKTRVSRMFKAAFSKSDAAKAYRKSYDDWERLENTAEKKWTTARDAYKKTGKNRIMQITNNINYDRMKKKR